MDFAYSDKVRELQMRVQEFMDTQITPNEVLYYQQVEEGGRWCVPPILDALKARAKQAGLWNLFLPESERGAGLTNLEYAPPSHPCNRLVWPSVTHAACTVY